jgi:hypothetical protein
VSIATLDLGSDTFISYGIANLQTDTAKEATPNSNQIHLRYFMTTKIEMQIIHPGLHIQTITQ